MIKRALLFFLGFWLIAASGLSAHAEPCSMDDVQAEIAASEAGHEHCDMKAAPEAAAPAATDHPDTDAACCCPAVLAALPVPTTREPGIHTFALPSDFPPDASAASLNLIPEPPPPKA